MSGNVLIHGATMVLPNHTGVGDLRIRNGLIDAIAMGSTLEPMDDELFIDGTGLHLLLESLTLNATSETPVNLRKRISVQGLQLP